MSIELSRRRFLEMSSALGALGGLVGYGELNPLFAQEKRLLTEEQVLGPFYPITKPLDRDADLTHLRGRHEALVTQMYFPGEALNTKDRLLQSAAPNQATLIAKVEPADKGLEPDSLVVTWDIVLTRG